MPLVERTIQWENLFDGTPMEATYYFKLGRTDLARMELMYRSDLDVYFKHLVDNVTSTPSTGAELMELWRELLMASVGVRNGNRLDKGPEIIAEFEGSGAYEQLFGELIMSDDGGASFFREIWPDEMREQMEAEEARQYSDEEKLAMSEDEFRRVAGKPKDMSQHDLQLAMRRNNGSTGNRHKNLSGHSGRPRKQKAHPNKQAG